MSRPHSESVFQRRPAMLGVTIAGVLLSGLVVHMALVGQFAVIIGPQGSPDEFRIAVVHCLLAGYFPAAYFALRRGAADTLDRLGGLFASAPGSKQSERGGNSRRWSLLAWGLVGVAATVMTPTLTTAEPWRSSTWPPEVWWHRFVGLFIGWWFYWFIAEAIATGTSTSRLADRLENVDLFDQRPMSPFVKQGLLTALLTVGAVSLISLMLVDPGEWPVVALTLGLCLPVAVLGLLLPVRGVHRRIRDAKQSELVWARDRIRCVRKSLHEGVPEGSPGKMADLIAYQRLVEDVSEWPFQASTAVQIGLYLLIPAASWLGGLVIEGLLSRFLR